MLYIKVEKLVSIKLFNIYNGSLGKLGSQSFRMINIRNRSFVTKTPNETKNRCQKTSLSNVWVNKYADS